MHFWLIKPLVLQLASGNVSERQGMHYYLASTLILLAETQYSLWWGPRSGWLFHFELAALVLITCIGISQCWRANRGDEFLLRIICLSVPAGVRVLVLSLVFGLLLQFNAEALFDYQTFSNPARAYDLVSYAGFIGFAVYFWYLLRQGLAAIAKTNGSGAADV
jgi:hypothetical protein